MAISTKETTLYRITGIVIDRHTKSNDGWSRVKIQKVDGTTSWVTAKWGIAHDETIDFNCVYNAKFKSYDAVGLADTGGKVANEVVVLRLVQELGGVGAVKARRLSEKFSDLFETITREPHLIAEACGVDPEEVARVAAILDGEHATLGRVTDLLAYGYPGHIAKRIAADPRAFAVALKSPYKAIRLVDGLGWLTADEVGRKNKIAADDPDRIEAGIDFFYREKVAQDGHTKVTADTLLDPGALPSLLGIPADKITPGIEGTLVRLDGNWFSSHQHYENARTIARFFGVGHA